MSHGSYRNETNSQERLQKATILLTKIACAIAAKVADTLTNSSKFECDPTYVQSKEFARGLKLVVRIIIINN